MTGIFGTFRDIGGELSQGSVTLQSIITRPSHLSSSEVVTTERHEIVLSYGSFTSPELDPGPTRVRFRGHGVSEEWEVVLPEDGWHDLAALIESQVEYSPPVVDTTRQTLQLREVSDIPAVTLAGSMCVMDGQLFVYGRGKWSHAGGTSGTTAQRPAGVPVGTSYFDTTLGKPVWLKASPSTWVDATGATA